MKTLSYTKNYCLGIATAIFSVCTFLLPSNGYASPLANDATVLNYLVEMERQAGKGCAGEPLTAPNLLPSPELQELADILGTTDTPLGELLSQRGLKNASMHTAFVYATSPKEAVQKLRAANCSALLNPGYTQIGSSRHNNKWTVVMAGDQLPETGAQPSDIVITPGAHETPPAAPNQGKTAPGATSAQPGVNQTAPLATTTDGAQRPVYGSYPDGEPRVLPQPNEHREPATPQVTGVYTDDTLTPLGNQQARQQPAAPLAPAAPPAAAPAPVAPVNQQPVPALAPQTGLPLPSAEPAPRPIFGRYSDGEPIVLPDANEHRDAAQPQVTGVYDDKLLTPEKQANQTPPAAPLAPAPSYPEPDVDPNNAAPPQTTGVYQR